MTPLVSIIIPCFNAGRWLAETLESALGQTWPNKEIIVVNDGSTDGSLGILNRFTAAGIQVIDQPNRGAAAARNAGLRAARGDWIQYLDADDLLAADKIERQLACALAFRQGAEFAWCAQWTRFVVQPGDATVVHQPLCTDSDPVDWLVLKLEQHRMMHPAAWLLSRPLVTRVGPWNEALSLDDDGEYFTRVVLSAIAVRCCADACAYYRSSIPGSLSGSKSARALASALQSIELSTTALLAAESSARTRHASATAFQRFIYEAYPRVPDLRHRAAQKVRLLGGTSVRPDFGRSFHVVARLLGWRLARRLQLGVQRSA